MRRFNLKPTARHITEANFRNSNEKIVGNDGNINGSSTRDVMSRILELANMVSAGEVFTDTSHAVTPDVSPRAEIAAAYHDRETWAELGNALSAELNTRLMRQGFMRTLLSQGSVEQGAIPRIRVRTPNVRAVVSRGVGQTHIQTVRDRYLTVDEFTIDVNVRVMELDLHQGSDDILEAKFYEGQEQSLVKEDTVVVSMLRSATGIYNSATYFSGAFTPTILAGMREDITDWSMPAVNLVVSNDYITDMMTGTAFAEYYDPITKYELIQTGRIGSMYGLNIITDGFREPTLQVLSRGESFMTTSPDLLGSYTDRGPLVSNPVDSYADGVPARGWSMFEFISAAVANAKGVATAQRV